MANPYLNVENLNKKGSPYAVMVECDSAGTITGSLITLPLIKESQFSFTEDEETFQDEGLTEYSVPGAQKASLSLTFMTKDPDSELFPLKDGYGKYFRVIKEDSLTPLKDSTGASYYAYKVYGICKLKSVIEDKRPSNEFKFDFQVLKNETDLTTNLSTYKHGYWKKNLSCTSFSTPKGEYMSVYKATI
mgnify:CR=1 FL=1